MPCESVSQCSRRGEHVCLTTITHIGVSGAGSGSRAAPIVRTRFIVCAHAHLAYIGDCGMAPSGVHKRARNAVSCGFKIGAGV